jgi:hypothetical protein
MRNDVSNECIKIFPIQPGIDAEKYIFTDDFAKLEDALIPKLMIPPPVTCYGLAPTGRWIEI